MTVTRELCAGLVRRAGHDSADSDQRPVSRRVPSGQPRTHINNTEPTSLIPPRIRTNSDYFATVEPAF